MAANSERGGAGQLIANGNAYRDGTKEQGVMSDRTCCGISAKTGCGCEAELHVATQLEEGECNTLVEGM